MSAARPPLGLRARLACALSLFALLCTIFVLGAFSAVMWWPAGRVTYIPTPVMLDLRCPGCGQEIREEVRP